VERDGPISIARFYPTRRRRQCAHSSAIDAGSRAADTGGITVATLPEKLSMTSASRWLLVVATTVFLVSSSAAADVARPPNIVFILADDLGYAELGCYGQKKIKTPRLDQMAAEGIRFTQFYCGNAVCAPSRCVLMTGKHPGHAVIRDNKEVKPEGQEPLPADTVTIAKLLKAHGYATAAIGKWGLGGPGSSGDPNKQGFDLFYGFNCQRQAHNHYPTYLWRNDKREGLDNDGTLKGRQHSHDLFEAEALKFIEENKDRPFFLYVPFAIPHVSLQVPDDALKEYLGKWDDPPYWGEKGYLPNAHPRATYAAMVTRMDRSVGRILDQVKKLGLEENTIVFFSSDNGPTHDHAGGSDSEFFESAGPFRGLKGSLYEGGIRAPCIVRWPGRIKPGRTSDLPGGFPDVLPTLCDVAGAAVPKDIDGVSILPTLLDKGDQRKHEFLYWEFAGYGGQQAARVGDWKGVRQQLHKGSLAIQLYNLAEDIGEKNDVAAKHPEVVERIAKIMKEQHTGSERFPIKALDAAK
jgi:arylsulfatase